jgi:hypothetical protein
MEQAWESVRISIGFVVQNAMPVPKLGITSQTLERDLETKLNHVAILN